MSSGHRRMNSNWLAPQGVTPAVTGLLFFWFSQVTLSKTSQSSTKRRKEQKFYLKTISLIKKPKLWHKLRALGKHARMVSGVALSLNQAVLGKWKEGVPSEVSRPRWVWHSGTAAFHTFLWDVQASLLFTLWNRVLISISSSLPSKYLPASCAPVGLWVSSILSRCFKTVH